MKYIVVEIQTDDKGSIAIVPPASYGTQNEAESKYHTVLAAAAVSDLPAHAAVLLTSEGITLAGKAYFHGGE